MEIGKTVIPNEDNDEEDLTRCNPEYLPLPAIRLGKGVWLTRWTLNEAERRIVAETGNIYMRMHALDGDELVMPHRLFVERPDIRQLKEFFGEKSEPNQNIKPEIQVKENSQNLTEDKDELRLLVQEEINKAFNTAFNAALNYPISISDAHSTEKQQEREKRKEIIRDIGNAIKNSLRDLKDETYAKIVEKTDPARAERIRSLKPSF